MAEKTIGIRIQLNGIDTVITDIQTLENEIRKAKEDLKQVEIGGPIFKQLAKEISQAETKLQALNDSARGLSKEKTLEGFGKLGAGISSSFAAATAAVSLFGKQSESVQKAAVQAQNLLTIALSLRGIAEVKTGAQIVAKTIAEKASTLATTATNTATKALYTTLAANPYGAILAVVGLLVGAFLAFGNAEDEVAEKTKTLNQLRLESEKSIITETNKLTTLQKILNDGNASLDAKAGAYEELKKLVPTLTNLTLEQAQAQGILNSSIKDEITLIELRAKQKAYEAYFVQEESKNIEKRNKERTAFLKSLSVEIGQLRQRLYYDGLSAKDVEAAVAQLKAQKLAQKGYTDEKETYRQITEEIVTLENKQTTVIKGQKVVTEDVTKSEEKRKKQKEAYIELLLKEIKLNSESLIQTNTLRELDNKIIDDTQKKVDTAQSYANTINNLKTFTQLYTEATNDLLPVQDKLGGVFKQTKIFGEAFIDSLDTVSYTAYGAKKAIEDFDKQISELSKGLSKDDQVLLQDFANNYKEIFKTVQLLQQFKKVRYGHYKN